MTRDEFVQYLFEGEQWTAATLAAARMAQHGMIPTCDIETFEREVVRPDGIVPFEKDTIYCGETSDRMLYETVKSLTV